MIRKILKEFTEIWAIPMLCVLFFLSPFILQYIDPTAGTWDWGVLQTPVVSAIIMLSFNMVAFMGLKYNFPTVYERYIRMVTNTLSEWQIFISTFCVISLYIITQILIFLALV